MSKPYILFVLIGFVALVAYLVFEYWWGRKHFPTKPTKSDSPDDDKNS